VARLVIGRAQLARRRYALSHKQATTLQATAVAAFNINNMCYLEQTRKKKARICAASRFEGFPGDKSPDMDQFYARNGGNNWCLAGDQVWEHYNVPFVIGVSAFGAK
jgi:hypothetical protein